MAEKGPPAPTPKPVRKPATQVKVKEPSQKKQNPSKATPPLEPKRVVIPVVPIDQPEDQVPLYPPNQPNQLPDNPQINQISYLITHQIHQTLHLFHQTSHPTKSTT